MSMKVFAAALLASALVSAPALAQQAPPAGQRPAAPAATTPAPAPAAGTQADQAMKSGQWRASKLVGLNVYNNNNEKIGDISELITDQSGKIDLVVIGVGGFLGMGQHNVAVQFSQIKWMDQPPRQTTAASDRPAGAPATTASGSTAASASGPKDYPDHAVVNLSKDQLKAMPAFRYASDARSTTSAPPAGTRTPPAGGQPAPQR